MSKNINAMTKEELLEHRNRLESTIAQCYNMQMAKKVQLNSAYGALG